MNHQIPWLPLWGIHIGLMAGNFTMQLLKTAPEWGLALTVSYYQFVAIFAVWMVAKILN